MDPHMALLKKCIAQLGEHFDAVQILATRTDAVEVGGTAHYQCGSGNMLARYGLARMFALGEERAYRRMELES